tara:strand:- start:428 stop:1744 length:1317 start_codon:yes stop_codon:yes gene_type:complete
MKYSQNVSKLYIFQLSVPIFFANIAIPAVGFVDTALMGHLSSEKFLAALSISSSVLTMIIGSLGFLRMATVGVVSQALGKGDYKEVARTIIRNLLLALILSIFVILCKPLILSNINIFFSPSLETSILIEKYVSIRIFSIPAELIIYVIIGFFLGIQKTFFSSSVVIFFCIMNIFLSIFFVNNMNLEIYGVALGTVVSSYLTVFISMFVCFFYFKHRFNQIPRFEKIFIRKKIMKLFNINFDIFLRSVFLLFAFLWITFQSAKLGEDYLAANTLLLQFIMLASFFLDSYAFSTESIIGFVIGRKTKKVFLKTVINSFELSFFSGIIISLFYILSYKLIINAFTDLDYIRFLAYGFIFWIILIPPVASFCYQFDGIFIGATQTAEMRNAMFISVVLFIVFSIYAVDYLNNNGLWLSVLFFMLIRSITLNFYFSKILKKF